MLILNVIFMSFLIVVINCQWNEVPNLYLGNTPYKKQRINSVNITTAQRIQRDIAMNITIDQLIWPALDMSTAFFGKNYSLSKLTEIDQPLFMGYKRLVLDLYWNSKILDWQLCPIELTKNATPNEFGCTTNYLFKDFLSTINDYLVSTQVGSASSLTDIITLVLNLNDLNTNINSTKSITNIAPILLNSITHSSSNYKSRIYTPFNLTQDRINTSDSFYAHGLEPYFPLSYQQTPLHNNTVWPQWLYLIQNRVQLLISFGSIQENASFSISESDKKFIFDHLGEPSTINNCLTDPISWSFVSDDQDMFSYDTAFNTTQCGYSPYFTHNNYSGDFSAHDPGHLADNILSTIWSWDIDEPNTHQGDYRCAAIQQKNGRWVAYDCAESLRVACRLSTNPNQWILTAATYNYDRSLGACPSDYVFDIPRLPKQNMYLRQAIKKANITDEKIWINLNMIYNQDDVCWAVGRYGYCWWSKDASIEYLGLVQTSIVCGVIVLLLVGIFIWVKCARIWRNRNSKPRKAMVKAMLARREYVTVPA